MAVSTRKNPYKTRQSFSKAVNRVRTELPSSPCQKEVVIESLASEFHYKVKPIYTLYIVYTMPGKGDEMTVWDDDDDKHKCRKYYLTMYLIEAYAIFLESCKNEDEKCIFSTFCNLNPKNGLLLGNYMKICSINWRLWGMITKILGGGLFYVILPQTVHAGATHVMNAQIGKKFVLRKALGAITSYKQWNTTEVPNMQKKRYDTNTEDCNNNIPETYKKTATIIKEVRVGEMLEQFQESLPKVMEHQNVKQIQAAEFQNNLKDDSVRVLQINYAMPYQCEIQKKTTKTMVFCTNYKGKDKFSMGLFLQMIYNNYILPNDEVN